jgi:phosphoribosylformylglycinamidine synthase
MPGLGAVACHDGDVVFAVLVEVRLRPGIADPQGATIERSLPTLGFRGIRDVSVGKAIRFTLEAPDEEHARQQVDELCQRFLINPVIEEAAVSVETGAAEAAR